MKKLKRHWKTAGAVVLALLGLVILLTPQITDWFIPSPTTPVAATPERRAFESQPALWLDHVRDFSAFQSDLWSGAVRAVGIGAAREGNAPLLFVTTTQGDHYSLGAPVGTSEIDSLLVAAGKEHPFALTAMTIDVSTPSQRMGASVARIADGLGRVAALALPLALLIVLARHVGGPRKNLVTEKPDTGFRDVIGAAEAKAALSEVVAFLKDPRKYEALGARPPRGVLLEGPPGTGKTLLARALAGECGANFIAIDGAYFSSMFFEQGIKRVTGLFELARASAPCVIFIDEIDGIGARTTGPSRSSGQGEENRIINKLLVEMDGFSASDDVVVVAATNHRDNIDPALLRPGRFDQVCTVAMPNVFEREELFAFYLKRIRATADIDVRALAKAAAGSSPADIALVVNRAAIMAAEKAATEVRQEDVHHALESLQLGGRLSNLKPLVSAQTRERIAVHEGGHAVVAHLAGAGTVGRISIEPRGQALGVTFVSREEETPLYGERELEGQVAMMLAGREAELLMYGSTTSGAADDLKRASQLALRMVTELGFSRQFGVLAFTGIPKDFISPATQERALEEARVLLAAAQERCRTLLQEHRSVLEQLRDDLIAHEAVSGDHFRALFHPDLKLVA